MIKRVKNKNIMFLISIFFLTSILSACGGTVNKINFNSL